MPGTRPTILYWPCPSVVAVRTFSISAGLEASTVTPGSTAPVVSRTTPAIPLLCATTRPETRETTATSLTIRGPPALDIIVPPRCSGVTLEAVRYLVYATDPDDVHVK